MPATWERGVVRVLPAGADPDVTAPVGAGFLAAGPAPEGSTTPGVIVTCAHVVLACRPEGATERPSRVQVVFDETGDAREAMVDDAGWRADSAGDIAILRIAGSPPRGVAPLPLGGSAAAEGHAFRTRGYPNQAMDPEIGTGTIEAALRTRTGFPVLQLTSEQVTTGYSGSPIWDEQLRRVVGMVARIIAPDAAGRGESTAFATAVEMITAACPELAIAEECPYRGLEPFAADDTRFYFGRREEIDRVLARLDTDPRVIAIFGPSGSGKSSLVQAGVIPRLDAERWAPPVTVRRYDDIDAALSHLDAPPASRRVLVLLDQFEEVFAIVGADRQHHVLGRVSDLVSRHDTTVVIVMRNDFYSRFAHEVPVGLRDAALASLIEVPTALTRAELLDIIVEPARVVGLRFQDGLAELIARDALATGDGREGAAAGTVLPLLEFALTQLWVRRDGPYLTHAAYAAIGGVVGGLTQWADEAVRDLSRGPRDRAPLVRRIMVGLVHVGDEATGTPDSRTSRTIAELAAGGDEAEVRAAVETLVDRRLITLSGGRDGGPERVQLVHDALIRRWDTLRDWLGEDRAFKLWEQAMQPRAVRWASGDGALLRDGELAEAERWLAARGTTIEAPLPAWIEASLAARREAERAARAARERLQYLVAVMTMLTCLFLGASILAYRGYRDAERESTRNQVQALASESQVVQESGADEQAAMLAYDAWRLDDGREVPGPVGTALQRSVGSPHFSTRSSANPSQPRHIATSLDGTTMAIARDDGSIEVSSAACAPPEAAGAAPIRANQVALNADGTLLAVASEDGFVHLWRIDGDSCAFERSLMGPGGPLRAVSLGMLGDTPVLAIGGCRTAGSAPPAAFAGRAPKCATGGAWVRLWALGGEPKILADRPIDGTVMCAMAIDPAGGWLAAAGCDDISPDAPICGPEPGAIVRWPLGDVAEKPECLIGHEGEVRALAFSPCGGILASGGDDRAIRLWEPGSTRAARRLTGHTEAVRGLAISRDCSLLGSASEDGSVGLWYLLDDAPVIDLLGTSTQWVRTIAFVGPDGMDLSAEAPGGRIRTWRLGATGSAPGELRGHEGYVRAIAFSPRADDELLASVAEDGTLRLWDLRRPWAGATLPGFGDHPPTSKVSVVAFSYDGRFVAAADSSGRVWVWDVAAPERPLDTVRLPSGGDLALAFHPHEYQLAAGTKAGFLHLWHLTPGPAPKLERIGAPVEVKRGTELMTVAFSPDGATLATGGDDGTITVRAWRSTGLATTASHRLDGGAPIRALAYSPDGTMLASGGDDAHVRVWNARAGYRLLYDLTGHEDQVRSLAFTPDSATLASGSRDQTIRLWSIGRPDMPPVMITGGSEWIRALAISPDGDVLAAAATQGRIRLLVPDSDALAAMVCERVRWRPTDAEWAELASSDPGARPPCRSALPESTAAIATQLDGTFGSWPAAAPGDNVNGGTPRRPSRTEEAA